MCTRSREAPECRSRRRAETDWLSAAQQAEPSGYAVGQRAVRRARVPRRTVPYRLGVGRVTQAIVVAALGLLVPCSSPAREPAERTRLTVAASGDFLVHGPVFRRALAYGGGRRYEFRPMLRALRSLIAGADLALCHLETPLSYGPPRGYPSFRTPINATTRAKRATVTAP
jgi:hypothetical protein